jgi:NAD(P)-dependent dehydrogenase (short-subunit alcohol dehydrogenase family)
MAKFVIITGASRGIGRVIALELGSRGYDLLLVARSEAPLVSVRDEVEAKGGRAAACVLDITQPDAGPTLRDAALDAFGLPWGLVNNAGMAQSAALSKTDDRLLQNHMELNFLAPMRLMRAVVPRMVENQGGRVVNVLSTAALAGYPYVSAYSASKHALLGATRSLAREYATKGVTFNAVCPGYVRTEMFDETLRNIADKTGRDEVQAEESLKRMTPQRRIFEPSEVAHAVAYLLEESTHGITGQALSIDGGEIEH